MNQSDLLRAVEFAANTHRDQRRKGADASPYINHPIQVAATLAACGIVDTEVLIAAILHDTIEDTETTAEEIAEKFSPRVRDLVIEVTDDKELPKETRKRLQVEHASQLSDDAKLIKIADKICNVRDVGGDPPAGWEMQQRQEYLDWAKEVIDGCRGLNKEIDRLFDATLEAARLSAK